MTICDYCKEGIDDPVKIHLQCLKKREGNKLPYFIHDEVYVHTQCLIDWAIDHYGEKE